MDNLLPNTHEGTVIFRLKGCVACGDSHTYHLIGKQTSFVEFCKQVFVLGNDGLSPHTLLTVVFGCALCGVADVGELFFGVGTTYNIIEELAINSEAHGQWELCRILPLCATIENQGSGTITLLDNG